ncbi:MAG: hypothetical protein D6709_08965 [Chloroflexi bacterium]|jgi:hypothetical protein|uniref:Uncharacterized protein n=1 Tax=Candidatus Thermofonsia Clade 3 bacterium TaxID=2364212 RepID=A0A2M8QFQ5_9CHLR|nr:hypothetical protein [Candidatus Roseilinea sp. NK_OTU-006]PJF48650.1 MAG: hypothetical protein CUN48_02470 [Candidatus Thermofonsia Clade 3 bacterium]RMG63274.1 MAG: hypothetical protein D6709_08965 [Chloroflexota bacterium]
MTQSLHTSVANRILVLVALLALTPVLLLVVELPSRNASLTFLGSPLSINLNADSLLILFLPVLTIAGVDWALRDHPDVQAGEVPFLFPFWMAPGLTAFALALLLTRLTSWPVWIGALLGGVVVLGVLIVAEYYTITPNTPTYPIARLAVTGLSYLIAFSLFTLIYSTRERSVITATSASLVALALALDLLAPHIIGLRQATLFAVIVSWLVGQATWALNYWNVSNWSAGVVLLTVFYVSAGVAQQHFQGRLSRSVLIEFAVVTCIALIVAWQLAGVR